MSTTIIAAKEVEKVVTPDGEIKDIIVQRVPYWDPPAVRELDTSELTTGSLYRALIGELTASLVLLYVSIATVVGYRNQSSAADERCTGVSYLGVARSFGATVSILVYSTSGVSGGHINPAVTFVLFMAGTVTLVRSVPHIVVVYERFMRGVACTITRRCPCNVCPSLLLGCVVPPAWLPSCFMDHLLQ